MLLLHICANFAILGIISDHRFHSSVSLLMTFLPGACIAPSSTLRPSEKGGSFLFNSDLISSCLRNGVFRNRVLLSSSGGQLTAKALAYIIWGKGLQDILINAAYILQSSRSNLEAYYHIPIT